MSEIIPEYKGHGKKVRIRDAYKGDAGRGRIRIDPLVIKEMNLKTGDVIEIIHSIAGKKQQHCYIREKMMIKALMPYE